MGSHKPLTPAHLSADTKKWWRGVMASYELESHHVKVLTCAAEAWDRMTEARQRIAEDGAYIPDRWGVLKAHPGIAVERDARTSFMRALRELALDVSEPGESRPAPIAGNAGLLRR